MKNYIIRTERFQDKTYVMMSVETDKGVIRTSKEFNTANKVEELLSMLEAELRGEE